MPDPSSSYRDALRLSTVGITLALCVGIGAGAGAWLDKHLNTEPAFTIVGFILGTVAGFVELFRAMKGH
ncbi:AtpZ/AtpI family protein [bacterium]|nr:AtpZ/AtpI family protein [bacterium]